MRKCAIGLAGIMAALLTGIVPAGEACGLSGAVDHGCCAAEAPEPRSSCCSQGDETSAPSQPTRELDCDCAHPVDTPVTIVAPNGQTGIDETMPVARTGEIHLPDLLNDGCSRSTERRVRIHSPPPIFLLDCSFLI